ncbi:hypothetical protein X975_04193, partial [Stegodyphus mimosarum]
MYIQENKYLVGLGWINVCFRVVESKGAESLLEIIKQNVLRGWDCWKAYNCLGSEGYTHLKRNHSFCFKALETGAHANNIEGT